MKRAISGFTIIEILVTISIIGLLSTIGFTSINNIQATTRDSQRESKISLLASALEKYYDMAGVYPGCKDLNKSPAEIAKSVLAGIDSSALTMPKASTDNENSITSLCSDISEVTEGDPIAYVGDGSTTCLTGNSCKSWVLKYRNEATGNIISINSKKTIDSGNSVAGISVPWPGNSTTVCKTWTAPAGKSVRDLYVSAAAENTYDFFTISADGLEIFRGTGIVDNKKIDISLVQATTLSVCMITDPGVQDGFGVSVVSVDLQNYDVSPNPNYVIFASQELYVPWPGDSKTVCKNWTAPAGKAIKTFYVTQATELSSDFFQVYVGGVLTYNKADSLPLQKYDLSDNPPTATTISACMNTDSNTQTGYGGQVTKVELQDYSDTETPVITYSFSDKELYVPFTANLTETCKTWNATGGKKIQAFYVSQRTEAFYDYFKVTVDGVQQYYNTGIATDIKVDTSAAPGSSITACMITDNTVQDGYGGQVTKVDLK